MEPITALAIFIVELSVCDWFSLFSVTMWYYPLFAQPGIRGLLRKVRDDQDSGPRAACFCIRIQG